MSEEFKSKFRKFVDIWRTGNVEQVEGIYTADFVYHMPPFPDMNLEALKQFVAGFRLAFPDFHVTIEEDIAVGNTSAHRWTWEATFTGETPLIPSPPTGKKAAGPGCHFMHWVDGKAAEVWHQGDWLGAMQQIGVIPPL
jgi:predicted ester cyclase